MPIDMEGCSVLLTAHCPDPKLSKAALAPFHAAKDGQTSTSGSGFVLVHRGQPVIVTTAALVLPLLQQRRRQAVLGAGSLGVAAHSDLVAGAELHATVDACSAEGSGSSGSSREQSAGSYGGSGGASGSTENVPLRLLGLSELPGVRQALLQLMTAPSIAGPGGWQLGWLLHRGEGQPQRAQQATPPPWQAGPAGSGSVQPSGGAAGGSAPWASGASQQAALMLEAACHMAVLGPTTAGGAAALAGAALSWPSCTAVGAGDGESSGHSGQHPQLHRGQPLAAVGAPFGVLSPRHFAGFTVCGTVAAVLPAERQALRGALGGSGDSGSWTAGGVVLQPALVLADLRCSPGMEGGPVFTLLPAGGAPAAASAATPAAAAPATSARPAEAQHLAGMLLPPLKTPAAQVELALVAPGAAVAAAVGAAMQAAALPAPLPPARDDGQAAPRGQMSWPTAAAAAAAAPPTQQEALVAPAPALAQALRGVVAVLGGGAWASGVIVSEAGHILTNAHLFQPPTPAVRLPGSSGSSSGGGGGTPSSQHPSGGRQSDSTAAAQGVPVLPYPPVQVLLPGPGGTAGASSAGRWEAADVLYVFSGPLDLAVLQLRCALAPPNTSAAIGTGNREHGAPAVLRHWRPLPLSSQAPREGQGVCVAGFPAINPRAGLGPIVTSGNLAKVVRLPGSGQPAMLLTTAAVHSGASGGAVLDVASGQLLGLVTSNAKHSSRSGGSDGLGQQAARTSTVMPHINFSIPAAQLLPVVAAASRLEAAQAIAAWQAVDAATAGSHDMLQVWRLDSQRRQQRPQQGRAGAGAFGGAKPPPKMVQLLSELRQHADQQAAHDAQQQAQAQQQQREPRAKL